MNISVHTPAVIVFRDRNISIIGQKLIISRPPEEVDINVNYYL
jgi:hypothetical protein